jgi:DNA polymerase III epsilon subunit-like protein
MTAAPIVFLDTETLGLDPDVHPILEVGMIRPGGDELTFQMKVTSRDVSLAHPRALEIAQFHKRYDDTRAIEPAHAARRLCELISDGTHLVGAVPSFDEERLRRLMWAHGYSPRWHYHLVDVEVLAIGYLAGRDAIHLEPPWDSGALSERLGISAELYERHTALGDARWAKAIYEHVMDSCDTGDRARTVPQQHG